MSEIPVEIARLIAEAEAEQQLRDELAAEAERQKLEVLTNHWMILTELVREALPVEVRGAMKMMEEMDQDCLAMSTSFRVDLLVPGLAPIRTVVSREKPVLHCFGNYRVTGVRIPTGRKVGSGYGYTGYLVASADVNEESDEVEFWFSPNPEMMFEDLRNALWMAKRVMERKVRLEQEIAGRRLVYENVEEPVTSVDMAAAESLRKLVRDELLRRVEVED